MNGEGFAYFRWHVLRNPLATGLFHRLDCRWCYRDWDKLQGRVNK